MTRFAIEEVVTYEVDADDEDRALTLHLANRSSFTGVQEREIGEKFVTDTYDGDDEIPRRVVHTPYLIDGGSAYRLDYPTLMAAPVNVDGSIDWSAECEVDFDRIDPDDATRANEVKMALIGLTG